MHQRPKSLRRVYRSGLRHQEGVALLIALIMLVLITLIGVAAARSQSLETRMAANSQVHNTVMQTSEAALRYAEVGLLKGIYATFSTGGTGGLYNCNPSCTPSSPYTAYYQNPTLATQTYAGPSLSSDVTSSGTAPAPTFMIEQMPPVVRAGMNTSTSCSYSSCGTAPVSVYRVTAYGVGADGSAQKWLQSIFY